jgi:nucleotide-binding universal stress UspA family protein
MKLLVPLDGSPASAHALAHAVWLSEQQPGSSLILLNVQNAETLGLSDIAPRREERAELAAREADTVFERSIATCRKWRPPPYERRAEYGPVAETIVRVARDSRADQIVMGTRGLGRLRGLLLGSVATQVVHLTPVPVTLVKEGEAVLRHQGTTKSWGEARYGSASAQWRNRSCREGRERRRRAKGQPCDRMRGIGRQRLIE